MTEAKALIAVFAGLTVLTNFVGVILLTLDVSSTVLGLAIGLLVGLGGFLLSLVITHYAPPEHRRR